jgi:type IV pilus assembly protein PilA
MAAVVRGWTVRSMLLWRPPAGAQERSSGGWEKDMTKRREGFTLIELMIVVAIIGILAAIAIPNFLRFQLRSKTGEAKANLAAIRTAEEGYFSEYGVYVTAAKTPNVAPTNQKQLWPAAAVPPVGFDRMGWSPEGEVFFVYQTAVGAGTGAVGAGAFTAQAQGDLDADGTNSNFEYVHPGVANLPGLAGPIAGTGSVCAAGGSYDAINGLTDLLNTVGPCGAGDGSSAF